MDYPTYLFNKHLPACRVENEEEHRMLVGEWFDHPPTQDEAFVSAFDQGEDEVDEVDAMLDEENGIEPKKKTKKKK